MMFCHRDVPAPSPRDAIATGVLTTSRGLVAEGANGHRRWPGRKFLITDG
jgi:hypothetical protein